MRRAGNALPLLYPSTAIQLSCGVAPISVVPYKTYGSEKGGDNCGEKQNEEQQQLDINL
jgi:hypothetical protein